MMRVQDAFAAAGIDFKGTSMTDGWVVATCQGCEHKQNLGDIEPRENGQQTEYVCPRCETVFVIVGPAPGLTGGYRLGDYVVLPRGGMEVHVPPAP